MVGSSSFQKEWYKADYRYIRLLDDDRSDATRRPTLLRN